MIEMIINRIPYDIEEQICKTIIKSSNYNVFNVIIICIVSLILIYFCTGFYAFLSFLNLFL